MDDSPIRSKTAPFSFENGLVWTGPEMFIISIRGVFKAGAINFKTCALKLPWPIDLFVGNLLINSRMSLSVI